MSSAVALPARLQALCRYPAAGAGTFDAATLPLLRAAASRLNLGHGTSVYAFQPPNGCSAHAWLAQLAEANDGRLEMDCALFAQLCLVDAAATAFHLFFPLSNLTAALVPSLRYIGAADEKLRTHLVRLPTFYKGHWVVEVGPDALLGLVDNGPGVAHSAPLAAEGGPAVHTLAAWSALLTAGLLRDARAGVRDTGNMMTRFTYGLVASMIALGEVQWAIVPSVLNVLGAELTADDGFSMEEVD